MSGATTVADFVRVEQLWGTAISLRVCDAFDDSAADDVFGWFHHVDDVFSTWRADTEISRLGRGELHLDDASSEVREVLDLCERVRAESGGAFDVRVGADPRVTPREGLGPLDPSGLVKGWALKRAAALLRERGAHNFVINAGGDVVTGGRPARDEPWRVGVQHPSMRDRVAMVLGVTDMGVATSGRNERGDHIVDPRTGLPATDVLAVTVVAADLALADGYATAALVLGHDGPAWLAAHGLAAAVITNDGVVTSTAALDAYRLQ
ncbi:MAG: FAD:protein transferase [Actinomycetota bacterium]